MTNIRELTSLVEASRERLPASEALLVGISGIDASGKGYVTGRLAESLKQRGLRCAVINADGWLNLPETRFADKNKAQHFYENAFRFDEMFSQLVGPLKASRSIETVSDQTTETATSFHEHCFKFENTDVILLEGLFLFKNEFRSIFDLAVWIDCAFSTALQRAIERGQERLSPSDTIDAYETIYFPAQRIHFELDKPRRLADAVFLNP